MRRVVTVGCVVVALILSTAAAVLYVAGPGTSLDLFRPDGRVASMMSQVNAYSLLADEYKKRNGVYPPDDGDGNGSSAFRRALVASGLLRVDENPFPGCELDARGNLLDLWGRPIVYKARRPRYDTSRFDLYSLGPNGVDEYGVPGNGDDICSWRGSVRKGGTGSRGYGSKPPAELPLEDSGAR
jgi:hypothetical protein